MDRSVAKAKIDLNRVVMPKQPAEARRTNFSEVALGYSTGEASAEAARCIECKARNCVAGCPVAIEIPEFIAAIKSGDFATASNVIKRTNALPGICGRVCPQESQCEAVCTLAKKGAPVAIGRLERYVADWGLSNRAEAGELLKRTPTGKRVAVIGSGPAGLTCAAELARLGHEAKIFESLHVAGGVLMYGIPEFRLPKAVLDWEIGLLQAMGVAIVCNVIIGRTLTLDQLFGKHGYAAVFIGTGAGLPQFLGIPGENLNGVMSANEFLTRINLMRAYEFPEADTPVRVGKRVAVIGAGNTAMDAVRTSLRMGAEEALIVYRRSEKEMGARLEEYHHAIEEGVKFHWLTNPLEILGNAEGWVTGLKCQQMKLGPKDASGRARPIPIEGSEFELPVDNVVLAIGTTPNPLLTRTTSGLLTNNKGCLVADEKTGLTSKALVFAGGDAVTGAATVILAAGAGKRAAQAIHEALAPAQ